MQQKKKTINFHAQFFLQCHTPSICSISSCSHITPHNFSWHNWSLRKGASLISNQTLATYLLLQLLQTRWPFSHTRKDTLGQAKLKSNRKNLHFTFHSSLNTCWKRNYILCKQLPAPTFTQRVITYKQRVKIFSVRKCSPHLQFSFYKHQSQSAKVKSRPGSSKWFQW